MTDALRRELLKAAAPEAYAATEKHGAGLAWLSLWRPSKKGRKRIGVWPVVLVREPGRIRVAESPKYLIKSKRACGWFARGGIEMGVGTSEDSEPYWIRSVHTFAPIIGDNMVMDLEFYADIAW